MTRRPHTQRDTIRWVAGVGILAAVAVGSFFVGRKQAMAAPAPAPAPLPSPAPSPWDAIDDQIATEAADLIAQGHSVSTAVVDAGAGTSAGGKDFSWRIYQITDDDERSFATMVLVEQPDGTFLYGIHEDPAPTWMVTDTREQALRALGEWADQA